MSQWKYCPTVQLRRRSGKYIERFLIIRHEFFFNLLGFTKQQTEDDNHSRYARNAHGTRLRSVPANLKAASKNKCRYAFYETSPVPMSSLYNFVATYRRHLNGCRQLHV